ANSSSLLCWTKQAHNSHYSPAYPEQQMHPHSRGPTYRENVIDLDLEHVQLPIRDALLFQAQQHSSHKANAVSATGTHAVHTQHTRSSAGPLTSASMYSRLPPSEKSCRKLWHLAARPAPIPWQPSLRIKTGTSN